MNFAPNDDLSTMCGELKISPVGITGNNNKPNDPRVRTSKADHVLSGRSSLKSETPDMCKIAGKEAARYGKDFDKKASALRQQTREINELRWSDLEVGKLLGTGAFCHVFEVTLKDKSKSLSTETAVLDSSDASIDVWELLHDSGIIKEATRLTTASPSSQDNDDDNDDEKDNNSNEIVTVKTTCFALKCLHPQYLKGKRDFADCAIDLVMEAKILACLSHPNIIKLHAVTAGSISKVFTKKGGYFLLLDRLYGSLDDRIRDWAAAEVAMSSSERSTTLGQRLKSVAIDVARGMAYLHRNMVIYRDLKPSNVGFTLAGEVKLYDFGLAREVVNDGRKMTGYTGSARYMAPEVARSDVYGLSADVYSFAILMWELCSLQKAYAGMSKQEHLELVVGSQLRPKLSSIEGSSVIKKLIQSCWNHVPDQRPAFSDIRKILCSELDLREAQNGSSRSNRFMRLRKQRLV